MDTVSLTTFMDFASKAGPPKLTVVRNWKNRDKYTPATDFYKRMREGIVEMHRDNHDVAYLENLATGMNDARKQKIYPELLAGYRHWWSGKENVWFDPPNGIWKYDSLQVNVNPELGLYLGNTPYLIKLHFKKDKLTKGRVAAITHMMHKVSGANAPDDCQMAVLDVRQGHLISGNSDPHTESLLRGEATFWLTVWPDV